MQLEPEPQPESQEEGEIDMEALLEEHLDQQEAYLGKRGDVRIGEVIEVSTDGALVDIGLKREGFVPAEDLRQLERAGMGEVKAGDRVPVVILGMPEEGYVEASIFRARLEEDWLKAEEMLKSGEIYETEVSGYNRGGLTIQFGRIRGFVPLSHIVGVRRGLKETERRERLLDMVGKPIGLRVLEVDRQRRRLIFSQRQAYRAWQRRRRRRLLEELEVGQRRSGVVSSITDFGVFVDLGGVDGLVHVSELAWHHIENPREAFKVGDPVDVVVLEVDRARERVGLSIKQTLEDPWEHVEARYPLNSLVQGTVTRVTEIGAFVELEPGIEGLLHVSELIGAPNVAPKDVLKPGERPLLKVLRVDRSRRRIGLSARRVRREEWEDWAARHPEQPPASEAEAAAPPVEETELTVEVAEDIDLLPEEEDISPVGMEDEGDADAEADQV